MVDHETTRPRDPTPGEHRLLACCFRQLAESREATTTRRYNATLSSVADDQRSLRAGGFTLAELLVTVGVLVLLVLLFTQLLNSSATIATLGHKQMDADSQAREVLDRMAIDLAQMIKRSDVDYYLKSSSTPQSGNDQLAFFAAVPGYYATVPTPAPTYTQKSPLSLVSYRINSDSTSASYNRMERMGKGLAWNGVSSGWTPIVFLPQTISGVPGWAAAVSTSLPDPGGAYEVIGPQVFRFEYCYLRSDGTLSITPPGNVREWQRLLRTLR